MKKTRLPYLLKASMVVSTVFLLWNIIACQEGTEPPDEPEPPVLSSPRPTVRVLIASSGLGDMSYNDNIFRGVLEAQQEHGFRLEYVSPRNDGEAEKTLRTWQEEEKKDTARAYFTILAASEFEDLARSIAPPAPVNHYLLFDTKAEDFPIPLFHFTGYGVSFLAGIAAYTQTRDKGDKVAYLGGQQHEAFIKECYDGFRDGYLYAGGGEVIETYLSTTQKGFAMPGRAYIMADSLYKLYPFIYAMAGNSNTGVYQYLRDYPDGKYTAGVDVDQSAYSTRIIGSMIKETDRCVKEYIALWMQGKEMPMRKWYTLESGFMSFKIAEPYKTQLEKIVNEHLPIAIKKEAEYEKVNANSSRTSNVRLP